MRKRGFLLAAVCMMMTGVLAGCGSSNEQTASTSQAVQTETVSEQETADGDAGEETETETEAANTEESTAAENSTEDAEGKTLVVYFSASGNTERVAEVIADAAGGELFELVPVEPYTDDDLDYTDDNSRVSQEHEDESLRHVELVENTVEEWRAVKNVYVGYPIWWSEAAWPVNAFIEANDFTGKTVIPFCTSASSGLGESGELLAEMAGTGEWLEGIRFQSSVSEEDVAAWVESLGLNSN